MKKYSSCLNCENRYLGCHSNCEKYKEYKQYLDVIKINKKKENLFRQGIYLNKRSAV